MVIFRVINENGQYKTLNEKGTAIDLLWKEHRCLICQTPLYKEEHTFCAFCRHRKHRTVVERTDDAVRSS